jgi:hypothetical protein
MALASFSMHLRNARDDGQLDGDAIAATSDEGHAAIMTIVRYLPALIIKSPAARHLRVTAAAVNVAVRLAAFARALGAMAARRGLSYNAAWRLRAPLWRDSRLKRRQGAAASVMLQYTREHTG